MVTTIKFDEKSVKILPKITDKIPILDMEDITPEGHPRVKQANIGDLPFGVGGAPYIKNVVRVEPTELANVTGKLYRTYADALAYIKASGSPSITNPWMIALPSGEFSENIEFNQFISIKGAVTRLTGILTSVFFNPTDLSNRSFIQDCIITKLDLSNSYLDGAVPKIATIPAFNCFFELTSYVKPVGAIPAGVVARSCQINSGDFTGNAVLYSLSNVILGGTFPKYGATLSDSALVVIGGMVFGGTFNGGIFSNCDFQKISADIVFNKGKYLVQHSSVTGVAHTIGVDTAGDYSKFEQCDFKSYTATFAGDAGSKLTMRKCTTAKNTVVDFPDPLPPAYDGLFETYACEGDLNLGSTATRENYGDFYDNSSSGMTSSEMQSAIDELKSIIPVIPTIDDIFGFRLESGDSWSAIYPKYDAIKNTDKGMDLTVDTPAFSSLKTSINKIGFANVANGYSEVAGSYSIAGMKAFFGAISLGTPNITVSVAGDITGLISSPKILLTPYPTIYPTPRNVLSASYSAFSDTTEIELLAEVSDKAVGVMVLIPFGNINHCNADGVRSHAFNDMSYAKGTSITVMGKHSEAVGDSNVVLGAVSRATGVANACGINVFPLNSVNHIMKSITADDLGVLPLKTLCKIVTVGVDSGGHIVAVSTYCTITHLFGGSAWLSMVYDHFDSWTAGMIGLSSVIKSFIVSMSSKYSDKIAEGLHTAEGILNMVIGFCSKASGVNNEMRSMVSSAEGDGNLAMDDAYSSKIIGMQGKAKYAGEFTRGAGEVSFAGDNQTFNVHVKGTTNDETYGKQLKIYGTDVFGADIDQSLVMPAKTAWNFQIDVVALGEGGAKCFSQTAKGLCKSITGSYSELLGITYETAHKSSIGLDCELIVECSEITGELIIKGRSGGTGEIMHWLADVKITQVSLP